MSVLSEISKGLSPDLPQDLGDINEHLDYILPKIIPYGEDLREGNFWLGKRWKEIRQDEGFHESILHIFNHGGEYILSVDGNLTKGVWKQLGEYNSLVVEMGVRSELFDVRFLNNDFMVMSKHGDQARKGLPRFFVLAHEPATRYRGRELDWRNMMEKLFNVWRENSLSIWAWLFFLIVIGALVYTSLY